MEEFKCKDCIHYCVCKDTVADDNWTDEAPELIKQMFSPEGCEHFFLAADVTPVVHGEWEECDWVEYDGHSECVHYPSAALCCSECRTAFKKELLWTDNYCPHCGAKMDGKGEGE